MHLRTVRRWLPAAGAVLLAVCVLVSGPLATEASVAAPWGLPVRAPAAVSSYEAYYNPFGDPWSIRKAANPSIPVALTPPCNRIGPKASQSSPVPEEIQFLATSSSPLIFEECSFLFDATDNVGSQRQKTYVAALNAANPSLKYLAFYDPATAHNDLLSGPGPYPVGLQEIEANHESWYVHVNGQPADAAHRVHHSTSNPQLFLYDITNPQFRAFAVQRAVASMTFHGLSGVVIEQCGDYPVFDPATQPPPQILQPTGGWADGCVAFLQELKQAAPNKLVIFLGYSSLRAQVENQPGGVQEQMSYDLYVRRANVSDGLFWEDPLGGAKASQINPPSFVDFLFARFRHVQDYAASKDNYVGVFVNTNAQNQSTFGSTSADEQHQFAAYYLAAYLTMFRGAKSPLVYYTPAAAGDQFRSSVNFALWGLSVGTPLATATQAGEAWYQREFSQARVFVNGSDSPWQVSLGDRPFITASGQPVTGATIAPRSGAIFRAIDSADACTPRPNVVITPTRGAAGTLQVSVHAGIGSVRSLRFETARGAVVDIPSGPTGSPGGFTHTPSGTPTDVTFTVRRSGTGGSIVPFVVTDWCGEWRTFVGGGPTAF